MTREQKGKITDRNVEKVLRRVRKRGDEHTHKNWQSTYRMFCSYLKREEGIEDMSEVDHIMVEDFIFYLSDEGYANSTVSRSYTALTSLFSQLEDWFEVIEENPMKRLNWQEYQDIFKGTRKREETGDSMIYVTPAEVDMMAENATEPQLRNRLIIRLLFQTGVRASELAGMKIDNLDQEAQAIHLKSAKTDEWRWVYYQDDLAQTMSIWVDRYRDMFAPAAESEYLFVSHRSNQLHYSTVNGIVKKAAEAAGIQTVMYESGVDGHKRYRITTHALRHGHCIEAAKSGIDVKRIADHCGHKSITRTQEYLDYIEEDVKEAYHGKFGKH